MFKTDFQLLLGQRLCRSICIGTITFFSAGNAGQAATVLFLGDSHSVGTFGEAIVSQINAKGHQVHRHALVGASPRHFSASNGTQRSLSLGAILQTPTQIQRTAYGNRATMPRINESIQKIQPEIILIALGENLADYKSGKINSNFLKSEVDHILALVPNGNIKCFWALPSWTHRENLSPYYKTNSYVQKMNLELKNWIGAKCKIISGTEMTEVTPQNMKTLSGDWLHYTAGAARMLATAVFLRMGL